MGACPARDRLSYMIPLNEVVDHAMTQTTVQTGQDAGRIGHVPKPKISSAQNDARYVARGKAATMKADPAWDGELEEANRGKRGRPFKYPDGLIEMIAIFRMITGMGYRECEGVAAKSMGGECAPDHTTICKRINRMEIKAANGNLEVTNGDGAVQMIIDGTGMIPSTRGEWIRHKWKIKRGFIRLSIMVDAKTRKILAFVITDETVGESPQLPSMLDEALEKLGIPKDPAKRASQVVVLLGDKGYDSRANFSHCGKRGVVALIPVRINANCRADGVDRARAEAVIEQLGGGGSHAEVLQLLKDERTANQKDWKKRKGTGSRWIVEIVISSFKRTMGESVRAVKWPNVIREISGKIRVYNWLLDVSEEAMKAV